MEPCGNEKCDRTIDSGDVADVPCHDGLVLTAVDKETAAAPIQNALYSTGKFTTDACEDLAEGILMFIDDEDLQIGRKN